MENNKIPSSLNGLSLLRVISVTMILVVHFGQSIPFPDILHTPIVWCQHGVQMFYLLSGFLIYASLSKNNSLILFYKKRLIRIIPIYFFVVVINIILFDCILNIMPEDSLGLGWWRYFLFLQTIIPSVSVDYWNNISALWTMSAFALFYLVAPLLWRISKRGGFFCLALIVLLYLMGIAAFAFYNNLPVSEGLAHSLYYIRSKNAFSQLWIFAVGGGMFVINKTNWLKFFLPVVFALLGLIYHKDNITMVCCFAIMIAAIGFVKFKFNASDRCVRFIRTLDEYSFSIYLGHTTIIEFIAALRDIYHLNTAVVGLCSVIGTIVLVWGLHNFVEKPTAKYFGHYL